MPKMKTHSGAKKRLRSTASGKFKRHSAFKSHLLTSKGTKRKRKLRAGGIADKTDIARVNVLLPYHQKHTK